MDINGVVGSGWAGAGKTETRGDVIVVLSLRVDEDLGEGSMVTGSIA